MSSRDTAIPMIVVGDFNQMIPGVRTPEDVYLLLEDALTGMHIITGAKIHPINKQTIDHIAVSLNIKIQQVESISNIADSGKVLSDHFGVMCECSI